MLKRIETAWTSFQAWPHFWDAITFACLMLSVLGVLSFIVWLLGLPGRIAISRKHPDAEAVYAMGWVGFLAVVPWIQALIWAFKPTDKIDIRYFPEQERIAEREALERLTSYAYGRKAAARAREATADDTGTADKPAPDNGQREG
ncbi:DUF3302 domain-containing protein [Tropicimonas sp. IMCC34043]|uniref:DUF3302 domain-containing protein n=1 Tax=Tropicimonas sp. IMCC34043 TaxID=2248760 RepID=UPI001E47B5E7|nr:DUF3302 domain-containing protein [Tropicimonas sp. IMCC34043]